MNGSIRVPRLLVAALIVGAMSTGPAAAQPFPGSVPARDVVAEPLLHVDATVYKLLVQGVESDGTLWLDFEGRPVRVQLEDIRLAVAQTDVGREARKRLGRFVGRWVRFAFRGVDQPVWTPGVDDAVESAAGSVPLHDTRAQIGADSSPSQRSALVAYAPIIDHLLENGLARYCPGAARRSAGLAEVEERARARGLGMWQASAAGSTPPCERQE